MKKGRKSSGAKYRKARKKKFYEKKGKPRVVKLGARKVKAMKKRGGKVKIVSLAHDSINVVDKGKARNVKIKNVVETPSNRFLARQNILTKGAVVETELGKVRITNRPSQEGVVQGVLVGE